LTDWHDRALKETAMIHRLPTGKYRLFLWNEEDTVSSPLPKSITVYIDADACR